MKIALDYDGTVTEDSILWKHFVAAARARGHDVRIVTFRAMDENTHDLQDFADHCGIPIIFTARQWKQAFCKTLDWDPDVWIDDSPALIDHDDGIWEKAKLDEWKENLRDRLVEKQVDSRTVEVLAEITNPVGSV